jgi:hypothetical protein
MASSRKEQIEAYFEQGQFLGVSIERCKKYLDESQGDPALALTALLMKESSKSTKEGNEQMKQPFDVKKHEQELHYASLAEAGRMAAWVEGYFDDHPELDISDPDVLERVHKMYFRKFPDSGEIVTKGYVSKKPDRDYEMSSIEAGNILAARAVKRQRKTKESYEKCFKDEGEADSRLLEIYTRGN